MVSFQCTAWKKKKLASLIFYCFDTFFWVAVMKAEMHFLNNK